MTEKQIKRIRKYLHKDVWQHIYINILTMKQKENSEEMKHIAFKMEEILQSVAATFGLCGMKN